MSGRRLTKRSNKVDSCQTPCGSYLPRNFYARAAFTLVELPVVIGIIALLISILLPSLSRVWEAANRTKCLSDVTNTIDPLGILIFDVQDIPRNNLRGNDESLSDRPLLIVIVVQ
jgi:hypothetical protein